MPTVTARAGMEGSKIASEFTLNLMAVVGVVVLVFGLIAVCTVTIPQAIRGMRSYAKDTPERTLFAYDLRLAVATLLKQLLMAGVVITILLTDVSMLRSAITRPMLLGVLFLLAATAILTPLRKRAIERTVERRRGL